MLKMFGMEYIEKLLDTRRKKKRAFAMKNRGLGVVEIARRLGVTKQLANYYLKNGNGTPRPNASRTPKPPRPTR